MYIHIVHLYKVFQFVKAISVSFKIIYIYFSFPQRIRYLLMYNFDTLKQETSFLNFKVNFIVSYQ